MVKDHSDSERKPAAATTWATVLFSIHQTGFYYTSCETLAGMKNSSMDIKTPACYRKEGNVLFNDVLNTFYLRLYSVGHMVKDNSRQ